MINQSQIKLQKLEKIILLKNLMILKVKDMIVKEVFKRLIQKVKMNKNYLNKD